MKNYRLSVILVALFTFAWVGTALAQYDDLYYDPDTDGSYYYNSDYDDDYTSDSYDSND